MRNAIGEAEAIIQELRAMKADHKPHEGIRKAACGCVSCNRCKRRARPRSAHDEAIQVGDYVRLRRLNYHGEVIALSKNKAIVLTNGMKMNVKM